MIKICYISALLGVEKRGIESYSLGLIKNLEIVDKSLEFTLVTGGEIQETFIHKNFLFPIKPKVFKGILGGNWITDHLAIFAVSPSNIYSFLCSLSLLKILINNRYNFYIPTNYFEIIVCNIARFVKKEKSKIIFVGHAGPGHDDFKALKLAPDIFVELTKPSYDWAKKHAPHKTKVELIPVGIDTDKFDHSKVPVAPSPFKNNNKIALYTGAFVPYKRPELAIKLIEARSDLNLIMIGQGPLLEDLKNKYSKLVSEKKLYFTGSIDHTLIPALVKLADFSVMTSTSNENSPSVIMEAMTMKKPVIATNYDRTAWIIQKGGVLTNPENIEEFSKSVDYCLQNYEKLSSYAYARSKYFSWKNVATEWNNFFKNNEK